MEENSNFQNQQPSLPREQKIYIRTMASDLEALKQGGGEVLSSSIQDNPASDRVFSSGGNKSIFTPSNLVSSQEAFIPKKENLKEKNSVRGDSKKLKIIGLITLILVIIVGLWALGYFVIYPWFFTPQMPLVE